MKRYFIIAVALALSACSKPYSEVVALEKKCVSLGGTPKYIGSRVAALASSQHQIVFNVYCNINGFLYREGDY